MVALLEGQAAPAKGEEQLEVGDSIVVGQRRVLPLGPVAGTLIVDLKEALDDFEHEVTEELYSRGVHAYVVPGGRRAEWLGIFTYELELRLVIGGFHAAQGRTAEENQAGAWHAIQFVIGAVVLLWLGWVSLQWSYKFEPEALTAAFDALSLLAIAAGLFAIGWLVSKLNKAPTT